MSTTQTLDRILQNFVDSGLPGCGLQVVRGDETIYEGYFGYSDLEQKTPITASSVYRQASLSKIPLYTVMMMLYEQGYFLLTDPLSEFFPEWKNSKKFVTSPNGAVHAVPTDRPVIVRDVLSMKCGLPYCNAPGETDNPTVRAMQKAMQPLWDKGHYTLREQIAAIAQVPQEFEPGTHWQYGFSSELAAGIIEVVCGKSIDQVFEELIFGPLEMKDTRSHFFGNIQERMVKLYGRRDGQVVPFQTSMDDKHLPGPEHECGWARLFATVNDYSKLLQMLANGGSYKGQQLMGRKTIDLMRTNGLDEVMLRDFQDTYNAGYGYGYGVRTLIDPYAGNHNGSLGAFGWTGGFGSWCEADPAERLAIVYMHNFIPNEELYHHHRIRTAAYGLLK